MFDDAHPALGDWVRDVARRAAPSAPGRRRAVAPQPPPARDAAAAGVTPSMALTPKEREVLELLARNLSNKEIGLAMQVGEETIKWHMKNLFAKLDAGTRKQVVLAGAHPGPARAAPELRARRLCAGRRSRRWRGRPPSASGGRRAIAPLILASDANPRRSQETR